VQVRVEKEKAVARAAAVARHATLRSSLDAAVADKAKKATTEARLERMWKAIVGEAGPGYYCVSSGGGRGATGARSAAAVGQELWCGLPS
jgi:hypothetical protein